MCLYDFPIARGVELDREKEISAEPIGHFAWVFAFCDDLSQTSVEKRGVCIDPPVEFLFRPNVSQIQSLFLQLLCR